MDNNSPQNGNSFDAENQENNNEIKKSGTKNQQMNIKEFIELLDIDDSWKERFRIIDEWYENGLGIKMTEKLKNVPFFERPQIYSSIYIKNGGLGTFISAYFFGPFYYLFKGLWLKAIIYTLIIMVIFFVICLFVPNLERN